MSQSHLDQQEARLEASPSVTLIIGPPGSGKSYRIRQIAEGLKGKCHIFAPTNSAAQIVGGTTIYKFLQCSPFKLSKPRQFLYSTVIIDEVFMFECSIMKLIKECFDITPYNNKRLFMFGDPYQLKNTNYFYDAFEDDTYDVEYLTEVRRSEDQELTKLLLDYRLAKRADEFPFERINESDIARYLGDGFTLLTGTHKAIKRYSNFAPRDFVSADGRFWYKNQRVYVVNRYGNCSKFTTIDVYKNGEFYLTDGTIIRPTIRNGAITYNIERGDIITVNLSQGQTLSGVILDLANFFEFGSYYTAISRVKNKKDIVLLTYPTQPIEADFNNMYC